MTTDYDAYGEHGIPLVYQQPAPATQQASQQEPVAWYVTGCCRLLDEDEAKAEARHIGGTARAIPLYTVPHADSVLEDAERLDWLLLHISGAEFRRIGVHYSGNASRADVDAARKQGANHD